MLVVVSWCLWWFFGGFVVLLVVLWVGRVAVNVLCNVYVVRSVMVVVLAMVVLLCLWLLWYFVFGCGRCNVCCVVTA